MQQFAIKRKNFGRIGVFLGGRSKERPISIKSGTAVYEALLSGGHDVVSIDTANGFRSSLKRRPIDIAFLALHGRGGEDGTIQKMLNELGIPYTGSGPEASRRAFNKEITKRILKRSGIPTPDYAVLTRNNWKKIIQQWKPPFVIKPVQEGSSIGIFFVERKNQGLKKIQAELNVYGKLLIERKIEGREFTVGILGNQTLPVIELKPKRKFYDFKAKYTKGLTDYLVPAPIDDHLRLKLQKMAYLTHQTLGLCDLSRVDIKADKNGRLYVLEANSIPGFTETSLLPKAARCAGLDFEHLCLYLLDQAKRKR